MPNDRHWPRVSVVTPSYNQAQFIEETIRSVLLQGYPNLEYILMDGGSTDGTLDIIRRYEPWLTYWVSEPDRGQTHAINKGWARATGQVLAYLNTDDMYLPGAIAAAAQEFSSKPDAAMVYGDAIILDEMGQHLRIWQARPFDLAVMFAEGSVVPQPATFFSRAALDKVGPLDEQWQMIMDYDLCLRIGMHMPTVCLPKTLARFRDHARSKSRLRFETMVLEVLQLMASLRPTRISRLKWWMVKRATLARLNYELALYDLSHGPAQETRAAGHLAESILSSPLPALKKPLLTGHIVKRGISGSLKRILAQWTGSARRANN